METNDNLVTIPILSIIQRKTMFVCYQCTTIHENEEGHWKCRALSLNGFPNYGNETLSQHKEQFSLDSFA